MSYTNAVYTSVPVGADGATIRLARDEATRYTADFTTDALGRIEHNP
jgi:tryptophanyl-tRNA synthetase